MSKGRFVVVVGPDGVGKTSVAAALLDRAGGRGRYFHFRPDRSLSDTIDDNPPQPKTQDRTPMVLGWMRILVSAWKFRRGYRRYVAPELANGALVVGDRWAYGYIVQPIPLKFGGPPWLARAVVNSLPRPDLVVNLYAEPEVIRARKGELSHREIEDELAAWRKLPVRHLVSVDSSRSLDEIADRVEQALA